MEAILGEVTNELMYETLKKMHQRFDKLDVAIGEVKSEITAMRGYIYGIQGDVSNIYAKLARHDLQLDRIENRLELRDLAEAKVKFEHALPTDSR
jgi:predicted  nucleic acid-binding Zn-ribbon protein